MLGTLLVATVFVRNAYCRFLPAWCLSRNRVELDGISYQAVV